MSDQNSIVWSMLLVEFFVSSGKHETIGNLCTILIHLIKLPLRSRWQKIIHISNAILFIPLAYSYETRKMFPYLWVFRNFFPKKSNFVNYNHQNHLVKNHLVNYTKSAITFCLKSKNCSCLFELLYKKA